MHLSGKLLLWLVAVIALTVSSQAGTRIFRDLEDVLRQPVNHLVFSAEVVETEFSQRPSSDVLDCRIREVNVLRDELRINEIPTSIRFSAYRPAPSSNHKNRSVYSRGSGLEFSLEKGQRYVFLCSSSRSLVRVESLENETRVLELLKQYEKET